MKKLVTVFALCAAVSVAYAAVESANIVGYQTLSITSTYKDVVSSFVTVGGDKTSIKLGNIIPSASFRGGVGSVTFFTAGGLVEKTAMYIDGFGWMDLYEEDPADYNEIIISVGKGFFAYCPVSYDLTVSGEVKLSSSTVSVGTYTVVGNATAVPITLGDIVPSAGFKGGAGQIIFFGPNGSVDKTAMYIDGFGWMDLYEEDPADYNLIALNPGDGMFAYSPTAETLTLPAIP